jgi:hypothetical protein
LLLAYGMRHDDVISIVVAALFLPFMAQVLGLGFGIWTTDWNLASQAALALAVSIVISIAGGVTVALAFGGPMLFDGFKTPAVSLGISLVIGAAAGLSTADDTGRRRGRGGSVWRFRRVDWRCRRAGISRHAHDPRTYRDTGPECRGDRNGRLRVATTAHPKRAERMVPSDRVIRARSP